MKPCAYCGNIDATNCHSCGAVRSSSNECLCPSCAIDKELRRLDLSQLNYQYFDTFGAYISRLAQARRDLAIAALCDEIRMLAKEAT